MAVLFGAYDFPAAVGMAGMPVCADELLLLLEALLLTSDGLSAPETAPHWLQLCRWIGRLDDAELEVFCQVNATACQSCRSSIAAAHQPEAFVCCERRHLRRWLTAFNGVNAADIAEL